MAWAPREATYKQDKECRKIEDDYYDTMMGWMKAGLPTNLSVPREHDSSQVFFE